jgi:Zn-finger nucleic acid-binding protein
LDLPSLFISYELAALKWIDPFTWITNAHDMQVRSAFEFEEISSLFKSRHSFIIPAAAYSCPTCRNDLERVYYEGVPIWRCKECKGKLVKTEQLSRIIVREEKVFTGQLKEKVKQVRKISMEKKGKYIKEPLSSLSCPACGNIMHRTFYKAVHPYHLEIDTCRLCNFFWLDEDELEIIQYLTQGWI